MTTAIQQTQVPAVIQKLRQPAVLDEFAKVLPAGTDVQRLVSVAMLYILNSKNSQNILNCDPISVLSCIKKAFSAGLELNGRDCHLVPYGRACEFQMDYKGIIKLARECDLSVVCAETVCEHDEFETWTDETGRHFKHKPNYKKARGEALAYYSYCKYQATGEPDFEVMTKDQVDAVRKRSKAGSAGPWVTDYDEMAKKTVIRRHSKRWDISPKLKDAMAAEDEGVIDVPSNPQPDTGVAAILNAPAQATAALPAGAPVGRRGRPKQVQAEVTPTPEPVVTSETSYHRVPVEGDDSDLGPQTPAEPVRESVAPPSPAPVAPASGPVQAQTTAPTTASAPPRGQKISQLERIKRLLVDDGITEDECMDYYRRAGNADGSPILPSSCANLEQAQRLGDGAAIHKMLLKWDEMCDAVTANHLA